MFTPYLTPIDGAVGNTADNGYFLYYDKSILSEEDVKTLDRILEASASTGKKFHMNLDNNGWYLASFFLGAGCTLSIGPDGKQVCNFNNANGLAAARAIRNLTTNSAYIDGNDSVLRAEIGGSIAAGVSGRWMSEDISEILGANYGATKLPTFTMNGRQVQMGSFGGFGLVGVNSMIIDAAKLVIAMDFADFLTNEGNQIERFNQRALVPSNVRAASSPAVQANTACNALTAQSVFATSQNDVLGQYWTPAGALGTALVNQSAVNLQALLDAMVYQIEPTAPPISDKNALIQAYAAVFEIAIQKAIEFESFIYSSTLSVAEAKEQLMFAFYDIDKNGVPELLIQGIEERELNCIYTLEYGVPTEVFTCINHYGTALFRLDVDNSGTILFSEFNRFDMSETSTLYRIGPDGYSLINYNGTYGTSIIDQLSFEPFSSLDGSTVLDPNSTSEPEPEPEPEPDAPYIYEPSEANSGFFVRPGTLDRITDAQSANAAIYEAIASMTPEQRRSGDALDMAALFIETAVRAGARWAASGEVSLSAAVLSDLAGAAKGILAGADNSLARENVGLLRSLRTNISIKTDERDRLVISFPDDVSGVAFDNVTIEAEFASVTLSRDGIRRGGGLEVRRAGAGGAGGEAIEPGAGGRPSGGGSGADGTGSGDGGDGVDGIDGAGGASGGGFGDSFNPLDFWSVGVIVLLLIAWGILAALKHRLRAWVVPTFCALAVTINACTYFLMSDDAAKDASIGRPELTVSGNTQTGGDDPQAGTGNSNMHTSGGNTQTGSGGSNGQTGSAGLDGATDSIEIILSEGVRATVSLPATGGEKDYLLLMDGNGVPQYSKYNPVTDTIDTRIRESGVYTLKEYKVSFIDVEQKNDLMKDAISQLASRGIMTGTTDGFFFPDKPITRAELVSAIIRAFDLLDPDAVSKFTDLSKSDWYYSAAATAEREGIISGFEDNTFRGDVDIPKVQLVVITANTLIERMGYIVPGEIEELLATFLDRVDIAAWSEGRIALAAQANVLIYRTDSLFAPRSIMTRGDAAIILFRVFNKVW